jgi:hypothetical protein
MFETTSGRGTVGYRAGHSFPARNAVFGFSLFSLGVFSIMAKTRLSLAQLLSGAVATSAAKVAEVKINLSDYIVGFEAGKPIQIGDSAEERQNFFYSVVIKMADKGHKAKDIIASLSKVMPEKDAGAVYRDAEERFKMELLRQNAQNTAFIAGDEKIQRKLAGLFYRKEDALVENKTAIPLVVFFMIDGGKHWAEFCSLRNQVIELTKEDKDIPPELDKQKDGVAKILNDANAAMHVTRDKLVAAVSHKFNKSTERGRGAVRANRYASMNSLLTFT